MNGDSDLSQCDRCGKKQNDVDLETENMCAEGNLGYSECCVRNICINDCEFHCSSCHKVVVDNGPRTVEVNMSKISLDSNIDVTKEIIKLSDDGGYYKNNIFVCLKCYENNHKDEKTYLINHWNGLSWKAWTDRYG